MLSSARVSEQAVFLALPLKFRVQKIDARRREIVSVQGDEKAPMRSPRSWLKKRDTSEMHLMNVFLQVSVAFRQCPTEIRVSSLVSREVFLLY